MISALMEVECEITPLKHLYYTEGLSLSSIYSEVPPEIEDAGFQKLVMENASTWM